MTGRYGRRACPPSQGERGVGLVTYEPPVLEEVGTVRDLTLAQSGRGDSDHIAWFRYTPPNTGLS
ncbi:lasso RiPP family leader peptide-containing protein [Phytoactinopolyspora halotolerans]|uniref:lasso RiPP family leader peptide-containing protein n=1 Tax=Phytoactinopolyspora halotolerans TaxID=1981512 RepID=UPI0035E45044